MADKNKKVLGKGLEALIPKNRLVDDSNARIVSPVKEIQEKEIQEIDVSLIVSGRFQPRTSFDDNKIGELVASIKEQGVVQPVVVRPTKEGGYEVVAGERRFRAATRLGMSTIPAVIKDVSDEEAIAIALVENIQREDLHPIEYAKAYIKLMQDFNLTQDDIAIKVGKNRATIANFIRLLKLPEDVQEKLRDGTLSAGHGKVLLALKDENNVRMICREILRKGLSVRAAERLVERRLQQSSSTQKGIVKERDNQYAFLEEKMRNILGTKVRIVPKGKGGKVEIEYYSPDDLERILSILGVSYFTN